MKMDKIFLNKEKLKYHFSIYKNYKIIIKEINAKANSLMTYRSGGQNFCGD